MKIEGIDSLAIFSANPSFFEPLHVGRPNLGNRSRLLERINDLLDRRWYTNNGPLVQEFEHRITEWVGVKYCLAVCNATVGLEIAIRALDLKGEVIIPSFTFISAAHALQWQGITPVFADVNPNTHNLDPLSVEERITPLTSAILGVHIWGRPCDIEALSAIAERHHLKLFFDAAHAFGNSHHGKMIGNFGELEIFSFHATKFLNSFEGGAIATNNEVLAHKMREMINFGFHGYDRVDGLGINGKMTEICAAMGLTSLDNIDEIIDANRRNYRHYRQEVKSIPGIKVIEFDETQKFNYQYVIIEIDEGVTGISRDLMVDILHAENVLVRRYFYPGCHRMEPYRTLFPDISRLLPETEKLTTRVMTLPSGTSVGEEEITKVCALIRLISSKSGEIKQRLTTSVKG